MIWQKWTLGTQYWKQTRKFTTITLSVIPVIILKKRTVEMVLIIGDSVMSAPGSLKPLIERLVGALT